MIMINFSLDQLTVNNRWVTLHERFQITVYSVSCNRTFKGIAGYSKTQLYLHPTTVHYNQKVAETKIPKSFQMKLKKIHYIISADVLVKIIVLL